MSFFSNRSARALWQAGDRARDAHNWDEARASYGQAQKLSPSRCGLWMQYGHAAKESGDLTEAEAAYRTALVIDPRLADTHLHLAHVLKRQGRFREAAMHFAKVMELNPAADVRTELEAVRSQRSPDGDNPEPLDQALRALGARTMGTVPNLTHFGRRFADYEVAMLNVKNLGYALARALGENLNARKVSRPPQEALASKPCTQSDMESDWVAYWASELRSPVRYHRKLWEFCYIAHALWQAGKLKPGSAGLGFGCGDEPVVGLFAKLGAKVLATDKPPGQGDGWTVAGADITAFRAHYAEICPTPELRRNIDFRHVDMRSIPQELEGQFDFCWSACSLEHLGTIEKGLQFIEASLRTLKPGGTAVHTTEYNLHDGETVDNWATVLFQRKHFEGLAERLRSKGYRVAGLDFNPGDGFLDGFVDIPPWSHTQGAVQTREPDAHLKLSLDGFVCTSFGLAVHAPG